MMEGSLTEFRNLRSYIWDFDGTLFDSYPVIIRNFRESLGDFGFDAPDAEIMGHMLDNVAAARDFYAEKFSISAEKLEQGYLRRHDEANDFLEALPMDGVEEFLRWIMAQGGRNYIFTHRHLDETEAYLRKYGMADCFRDIVGPETPGFQWKPSPAGLLVLLERNGLNPSETVMIGDREIDLASGRGAGLRTMHVVCPMAEEHLRCHWRLTAYPEALEQLKNA